MKQYRIVEITEGDKAKYKVQKLHLILTLFSYWSDVKVTLFHQNKLGLIDNNVAIYRMTLAISYGYDAFSKDYLDTFDLAVDFIELLKQPDPVKKENILVEL